MRAAADAACTVQFVRLSVLTLKLLLLLLLLRQTSSSGNNITIVIYKNKHHNIMIIILNCVLYNISKLLDLYIRFIKNYNY